MAVSLADLLDEKLIDLDLRTRTVSTALGKLVEKLATEGLVKEPGKFLEQIMAREKTKPSAVEEGVAFPHVRTDLVEKIVLAIGRSRAGLTFEENGERAHLIFLIGVPQRLVNDYLVTVGALARRLRNPEFRQRLRFAASAAEFVEILKQEDENPFA